MRSGYTNANHQANKAFCPCVDSSKKPTIYAKTKVMADQELVKKQ